MKKLKTTILGLLLCSGSLYAQSTLNASGGGGTIGSNTYDYSIGEMTLVSTETSSTIIITQGLLQPESRFATSTKNLIITQNQMSIYPNPTTAIINIQPQFTTAGTMQLRLVDAMGKIIIQQEDKLSSGTEKQQIDISGLAIGNYLLSVIYTNNQTTLRNTYKIQKNN
jgi:hypothetical protein